MLLAFLKKLSLLSSMLGYGHILFLYTSRFNLPILASFMFIYEWNLQGLINIGNKHGPVERLILHHKDEELSLNPYEQHTNPVLQHVPAAPALSE